MPSGPRIRIEEPSLLTTGNTNLESTESGSFSSPPI